MRAVIVFAALLALGPLLWKLTHSQGAPPVSERVTVQSPSPVHVSVLLTFSTLPKKVAILHLGREVWAKAQPGIEEAAAFDIPWPKEGVELRALVGWPEGSPPAAMRMRVTDPAGDKHDRSVWGRGAVDEVIVFP